MTTLTIAPAETHLPLLAILQRRLPTAPIGYLRQLLRHGRILGPEGAVHAEAQLIAGTVIRLPDSARLQALCAAVPQLTILFESRELLVVDKPAGLAVHAGVGHTEDNLTARVEQLLRLRGEIFRVAPVHRLDLETSGPVLFGKGKAACGALGQLFMHRAVDKVYLGLVAGHTAETGRLTAPVMAKGKSKEAEAAFRALARNQQASLLELTLHTGRQHQLRVQLARIGHPLFGDRRYGGPAPQALPRLFLHCRTLALIDPFSGTHLRIDAPLPADLEHFLPVCGLDQI